jgi:hypothetical protein
MVVEERGVRGWEKVDSEGVSWDRCSKGIGNGRVWNYNDMDRGFRGVVCFLFEAKVTFLQDGKEGWEVDLPPLREMDQKGRGGKGEETSSGREIFCRF